MGLLGLRYLPCVPLDYVDLRVTVLDWKTHEPFSVERIYRSVMNNQVLPYKTTKHLFAPMLPGTEIPLEVLRFRGNDLPVLNLDIALS